MRELIRKEVASIVPLDALEEEHRQQTLAWIGSGAELCRLQKPATPPRHLVSYFVVLAQDAVLLVDHKKAKLWLPTGGHVEPGEHPKETVVREAREELGVEAEFLQGSPLFVTVTETVGTTAGHTDVSLWYVLKGKRGTSYQFDREEFEDVRWFGWEEVPFERSDPHLKRFLEKCRKQKDR
jgi:8-oxo-dGTP pyrophosphatase MutT (NUDIX family)